MKQWFFIFSLAVSIIIIISLYENFLNNQHIEVYEIKPPILASLSPTFDKNLSTKDNLTDLIENLPKVYFEDKKIIPSSYNESCGKFPKLFDVKFTSSHWQTLKTTNSTLQMFNAYYDHRNVNNGKQAVRIITMFDEFNSDKTFYCQLWYEDSNQPIIVKSEKPVWIWIAGWGGNSKTIFHPYIITCLLSADKIPMSISLVEKPCDNANNNLRVFYKEVKQEDRKNFLVCVKGLNFPDQDNSAKLVEWTELLFILGADKINFYKYHVHPNVDKVLDYYTTTKNVEVTPLSLVDGASNSPYLQSIYIRNHFYEQVLPEVIAFNDCMYKHLQEFKFVLTIDTDEVIIPTNGTNWIDLINTIYKENITSYIAQNVYFLDSYQHNHEWFDNIPKFFHMLQHVYRSKLYTKVGYYVKGFHLVDRIIALHNHFPISCFGGCHHLDIDLNLAHLQHYRRDCASGVSNCNEMKSDSVLDKRIWNYKEQLIENCLETLNKLNLVKYYE